MINIYSHLSQFVQLRIAGKQSECWSCGTTVALSIYSSIIVMLFQSPAAEQIDLHTLDMIIPQDVKVF